METGPALVTREELLNRLTRIYNTEQRGKMAKWVENPLKRLYVFWCNRIIYPFMKQGKLVKATTFWNQTMAIQLPAAAEIFLTGAKVHSSEIQLCKWLVKSVSAGETFIDGGAHYGFFSLLFGYLSQQSKVWSFEPHPTTFGVLQKNKQSNQILSQAALSNYVGIVSMTRPDVKNSEGNEILPEGNSSDFQVPCTTIDEIFNSEELKPDYIKLDIEGHEFEAISGAIETIKRHHPIIILEIWNALFRDNSNQLKAIQLLQALNYQLYLLDDDGKMHACNNVEQLKQFTADSFNVILKTNS